MILFTILLRMLQGFLAIPRDSLGDSFRDSFRDSSKGCVPSRLFQKMFQEWSGQVGRGGQVGG